MAISQANFIKKDIQGIYKILSYKDDIDPGLYPFPILNYDGRETRLHLRVNPDQSGILFVDVTDVIHLNKAAVLVAKLALEGFDSKVSQAILLNNFNGVKKEQLVQTVNDIYAMIDHFKNHDGGCMTCELSSTLQMAPLFSLKVSAPYKVDIALTYGCNNNCAHCYNEASRFSLQSLAIDQWFTVIDKLVKIGVPHLILTGGEATLNPDLPEIIKYADDRGMIVGLNSNGRYLANAEYMNSLAKAGLNHVQITLGSHIEEMHNKIMGANAFHQTVKGIKTALDSGVHVITNTTLMRSNMEFATDIIDFIFDLGIKTFAMNGMIYSGGGFEDPNAISEVELPPILVKVRNHARRLGMKFLWYTPTEYCRLSPIELEIGAKRCNAGEYSMCIEPNGDVLPCQSYYVAAGNILNDPWDKIWKSELFLSFRERGETPEFGKLPKICWECPDLDLCGGGCRIEREAREGVRISDDIPISFSGCSGSCSGGGSIVSIEEIKGIKTEEEVSGYKPFESQVNSKKRSRGKDKRSDSNSPNDSGLLGNS